MHRRITYAFISLSFALLASACSQGTGGPTGTPSPGATPAQAPTTSVKFVKASVADAQIVAGGSADAIVKLTIQNGYHVNANPPTFSYLRATEVLVQTGEGVSVGFITYPTPLTKRFSFADQPLAVYEGEVAVKVMLKAIRSAARGARSLPAKVNIQACDDQVCYAPGTLEISLPVIVK